MQKKGKSMKILLLSLLLVCCLLGTPAALAEDALLIPDVLITQTLPLPDGGLLQAGMHLQTEKGYICRRDADGNPVWDVALDDTVLDAIVWESGEIGVFCQGDVRQMLHVLAGDGALRHTIALGAEVAAVFPAEGGFLAEAVWPSGDDNTTVLTRYALDGGILWRRTWADDAYWGIMACVFQEGKLYAAGNARANKGDCSAPLVLCLDGETGTIEWEQRSPVAGDAVLRHIALTEDGIAALGFLYTDENLGRLLLQCYTPEGALLSQHEIGFDADAMGTFTRSLLQVQGEAVTAWGVVSFADSPIDYVYNASAFFAVPEGYSPLGLVENASGDVYLYGLVHESADQSVSDSFLMRVQ
jgi:hypothetical protein